MRNRQWSRRDVLKTSARSQPAHCSPNRYEPRAAANKCDTGTDRGRPQGGKLSYYSALELNVAERLGKALSQYPGISVRVEPRRRADLSAHRHRSRAAASMRSTSPIPPIRALSRLEIEGLACALSARRLTRHFPADQFDPDGLYATSCGWIETIGYNTNLVKPDDAPRAMWICSIRSGKAKSSRRIPAIAARS